MPDKKNMSSGQGNLFTPETKGQKSAEDLGGETDSGRRKKADLASNSPKKAGQKGEEGAPVPPPEHDMDGDSLYVAGDGLTQEEFEALMAEATESLSRDDAYEQGNAAAGYEDGFSGGFEEAPQAFDADLDINDKGAFDLEETFFPEESGKADEGEPAGQKQGTFSEGEDIREPHTPLSRLAMQARAGHTDYLENLNAEQRAAVEHLDGSLLVLAGAGTGKTRVLTTRIAHILQTGQAAAWQILAVTFTNKAAREMKQRIGALVGEAALEGMPWLGTFHSIGVKILRRHAELVGLQSGFTILDTDDQMRLLKQVMEAEKIDEKRWPVRRLAGLIDSWKNRGLTPERMTPADNDSFANGKGKAVYTLYQKRLRELNAADFGDLLLLCLQLFAAYPDVLAEYQRKFRYILVDEYQDTNVCQYLWLRLLGQKNPNLCVVGDDDQSIYGWRGAEVENILRFNKDFPDAQIIRLEQNYRSTGHILGAASGLIAHNSGRLGKTLYSNIGEGTPVKLASLWDDEEEARTIAEEIEILHSGGTNLNEIAILVRASFQMRAFEDKFVTMDIPYRVIGGPRFYERAEIKDAIAYLEATHNPANDLRFERILNVPKRGLGNASVKKMHEAARTQGLSLMRAAHYLVDEQLLTPAPRKSLAALLAQFESWRQQMQEVPHTDLVGIILDESGYTDMLKKEKSQQAIGRLENLKELVRFMGEFEDLPAFLEHVSLVMDTEADDNRPRVNVMTLHAAKGLEFEHVFLPGWEEGLFPHQRSLDETGGEGLEEERRLAYVGLTRARHFATLSFVQSRRVHGRWQPAIPSRFIDELPATHVEIKTGAGGGGGSLGSWGERSGYGGRSSFSHDNNATSRRYEEPEILSPGQQRARNFYAQQSGPKNKNRQAVKSWAQKPRSSCSRSGNKERSSHNFKVGEQVVHKEFGTGQIVSVEGDSLKIEFETAGLRCIVASYVEAV